MKTFFHKIANTVSSLVYPSLCEGCGTAILTDSLLCSQCFTTLPFTKYNFDNVNPVAKIFFGRVTIEAATSALYFTKDSLVQHLIKELKYKNNSTVGIYLGEILGYELQKTPNIKDIDCIIPLPLNIKKEYKRGYNQAMLIAEGLHKVLKIPIEINAVERVKNTTTQTHENRINRWQHMEDVFELTNANLIKHKHVLLVDDVVTTGATLESCAQVILQEKTCKVSIATVAQTY